MAEITRPPRHERLLIKVIMPKQGTERKVAGGGPPAKPFRPVDSRYRARLSTQVSAIRAAIVPQVRTAGAAPVRVKLLAKAAAKSHRPENLFSAQSCPIVGAGPSENCSSRRRRKDWTASPSSSRATRLSG
jgi:hypothetical protein